MGEFKTLSDCLSTTGPLAVRSLDIGQPERVLQLPPAARGGQYERLLALVRREGVPLGWLSLPVDADGRVWLEGFADRSSTQRGPLGDSSVAHEEAARLLPLRAGADSTRADQGPLITVVVATCADAPATLRCVAAILDGAGASCEIVVVENRPADSRVGPAVAGRFGHDVRVRYLEESRPGLSSARNAGLRAARGEIVAFTDDDVIVDPSWIPSIRAAFASSAPIGCVTGLIVPLEFESPAQILIERFASYGKGLTPRLYSLACPPDDQPLFPYAAGHFASGANIAFRTSVIRALGGFDVALGTGTRARGCEDLDICIRLLHAGGSLAYDPRAIVWHRHPDTSAGLRRRVFDYGTALGAMLTKHVLFGASRLEILRRAPLGLRYFLSPGSRKNASRGAGFPRGLSCLELAGVLYGPFAFIASRLRVR